MKDKKDDVQAQNAKICELASNWSLYMFQSLNNKLEEALVEDINKT